MFVINKTLIPAVKKLKRDGYSFFFEGVKPRSKLYLILNIQ